MHAFHVLHALLHRVVTSPIICCSTALPKLPFMTTEGDHPCMTVTSSGAPQRNLPVPSPFRLHTWNPLLGPSIDIAQVTSSRTHKLTNTKFAAVTAGWLPQHLQCGCLVVGETQRVTQAQAMALVPAVCMWAGQQRHEAEACVCSMPGLISNRHAFADCLHDMQQVDEAVPLLASQDKDPNFRKAVSSLKAVHPPRNGGPRMLPANLTKPKQDPTPLQLVSSSVRVKSWKQHLQPVWV